MTADVSGLSLPVLLLVLAWLAAGWGPAGRLVSSRGDLAWRGVLALFTGSLAMALVLFVLDLAGVRWTTLAVTLSAAGLVAASAAMGPWRPTGGESPPSTRWRLDLALTAPAVLLFTLASALRWNVHADYVYHWGQKAARNVLAGGLDVEFLAQPWNAHIHPDYPNLMPTLGAAAFAVSEIAWPATAVLAVAWFLALVAALGVLARRLAASRTGELAALGVATWGAAAFAVGYRQAGGADLPMTAAVVAGAAVLAGDRNDLGGGPRSDLQVALIAAFLAGSKLEGMPCAALLLALHALRRLLDAEPGRRLRTGATAALRSAGPSLVMVAVWAVSVLSHDLFLESNTGDLRLSRLPAVARGLLDTMLLPDWWGLPLALVALPLFLVSRRLRFVAAFLAAQLAFYVYSYVAAPVDTGHWIDTSAPRLLFHLVPATLVLALCALDRLTLESADEGEPAGPNADPAAEDATRSP